MWQRNNNFSGSLLYSCLNKKKEDISYLKKESIDIIYLPFGKTVYWIFLLRVKLQQQDWQHSPCEDLLQITAQRNAPAASHFSPAHRARWNMHSACWSGTAKACLWSWPQLERLHQAFCRTHLHYSHTHSHPLAGGIRARTQVFSFHPNKGPWDLSCYWPAKSPLLSSKLTRF